MFYEENVTEVYMPGVKYPEQHSFPYGY